MAYSAPSAFPGSGGAGLLASPSGSSRLTANRSPAAMKVLEFCASKPEVNKSLFLRSSPSESPTAASSRKKTQPRQKNKKTKTKTFLSGSHHRRHALCSQDAHAGRPRRGDQRAPCCGKREKKRGRETCFFFVPSFVRSHSTPLLRSWKKKTLKKNSTPSEPTGPPTAARSSRPLPQETAPASRASRPRRSWSIRRWRLRGTSAYGPRHDFFLFSFFF